MTSRSEGVQQRLPAPGQMFFFIMYGFMLVLILKNPEPAIEYIKGGLVLCVRTVIPSLFPFMVISELVVASGLGELAGKYLSRPLRRLFGISGASACAVILGAICGFPVGAKTTATLLDRGCITKKEALRLLTFCNNPSPAFIINAVGVSLFSNRKVGIVLYAITLFNAFLIGFSQRFFSISQDENNSHDIKKYPGGISAFTLSVTHAAESMLIICAYIVFFSSLVGCLADIISGLNFPAVAVALLYGILELSGGVSTASALGPDIAGICLCAFIIGWSGLSVHFQVISACSGRGLSYKGYFAAKLISGLLNSILTYVVLKLFPGIMLPPDVSTAQPAAAVRLTSTYIIAVLLVFAAGIAVSRRKAG
ncbi:MAG: sporulation protein [Clostridiales bacterium]|nr:sporulation protein [Clostridiales bacterium]